MNLKKAMLLLVALLPVTVAASSAQAQWVGFGIGVGVPYYRPYPYLPPYYARPFYRNRYPVYAAPPVYVTRPPVYYYPQPAQVVQQSYYSYPAITTAPRPRAADPRTGTFCATDLCDPGGDCAQLAAGRKYTAIPHSAPAAADVAQRTGGEPIDPLSDADRNWAIARSTDAAGYSVPGGRGQRSIAHAHDRHQPAHSSPPARPHRAVRHHLQPRRRGRAADSWAGSRSGRRDPARN